MQERIDKNRALGVKKYQRFGESKGNQELPSDIKSVNEELTHSTQAFTKNFGKKSEIDGYVKNLDKKPQTVGTHIQIDLPAKSTLDAQTIMSQSQSNLSSSFFSKATTATSSPNKSAKYYNRSVIEQITFGQERNSTSIPSQMTFGPNTQEDRAKNIIAKRQQMLKEFAHKYRENAQNNNVEQSNITLVPNRTKFLRGAPFGPKPMNTPKLLQH